MRRFSTRTKKERAPSLRSTCIKSDICEMKKGRMSREMVGMLRELMDPDRMSDEVAKFWLKYGIDEAAGDDEMTAGDGAVEVADDIATPVKFEEAEC